MYDPDAFIKKAKEAVADTSTIAVSDLYIVWFVKALGNWKALLSTDVVDDYYWEVTHNGAKSETYVDMYRKVSNDVVPD